VRQRINAFSDSSATNRRYNAMGMPTEWNWLRLNSRPIARKIYPKIHSTCFVVTIPREYQKYLHLVEKIINLPMRDTMILKLGKRRMPGSAFPSAVATVKCSKRKRHFVSWTLATVAVFRTHVWRKNRKHPSKFVAPSHVPQTLQRSRNMHLLQLLHIQKTNL